MFFIGNQIQHVGERLLENLHDTQTVSFKSNSCIDLETNIYDLYAERSSIDLPSLIENLRKNCKDIELETTTASET
jgi:hypothetical protein